MRLLTKRLAVVVKQLAETQTRIDAFLAELGGADPATTGSEDPQPGQAKGQLDATILRSIPGVGRYVLATLLAEADDPLRRRDFHALRCLSGAAPVTKQSGRVRIVTRRLAVHDRLRDALGYWASGAVQKDPACKARYQALRDRGHGDHRALRSVADRLLFVDGHDAARRHGVRPAARPRMNGPRCTHRRARERSDRRAMRNARTSRKGGTWSNSATRQPANPSKHRRQRPTDHPSQNARNSTCRTVNSPYGLLCLRPLRPRPLEGCGRALDWLEQCPRILRPHHGLTQCWQRRAAVRQHLSRGMPARPPGHRGRPSSPRAF